MPGGDGTGPMGMGPMTGRAAGFCAGFDSPGYAHGMFLVGSGFARRGRGRGRMMGPGGRGRLGAAYRYGAGWGYGLPYRERPTVEQETEALNEQLQFHEEAIHEIKQRISELEKSSAQ